MSWVAHALTSNPLQLFDANIFYPHTKTLLLSEPNIVAGMLATPAWILTRNSVLAHNTAFLLSFVLSAVATYYLAKHLTGNRSAAAVAAVIFAFCPYVFAHTTHINLELTAGLPLTLLAVHRHVEKASVRRGSMIGVVIGLQVLACGYYGVLLAILVPVAILFFAVTRGLWRSREYWAGAISGASISALIAVPLFLPYLEAREVTGFARTLEEARGYSANWESYVMSAAWAHRWWLDRLGPVYEVLFPGFFTIALGAAGVWGAWRVRGRRELAAFYLGVTALSFWLSLGPDGGLYTILHRLIPVFPFLRAPGRFGIGVILGLAILSAFAVSRLSERLDARWRPAFPILPLLVAAELFMGPISYDRMPRVPDAYRLLATLPDGPVAEFPFYRHNLSPQFHAFYMMFSTYHWHKLINGYSDIPPADFAAVSQALGHFPDEDAIRTLRSLDARYLVVHYPRYDPGARKRIEQAMKANAAHFQELRRDDGVALYAVVSWPSDASDRGRGASKMD